MLWTIREADEWVPEPVKPGTRWGAKRTKLKLAHFRHLMRGQGSVEGTALLGKQKAGGRAEGHT